MLTKIRVPKEASKSRFPQYYVYSLLGEVIGPEFLFLESPLMKGRYQIYRGMISQHFPSKKISILKNLTSHIIPASAFYAESRNANNSSDLDIVSLLDTTAISSIIGSQEASSNMQLANCEDSSSGADDYKLCHISIVSHLSKCTEIKFLKKCSVFFRSTLHSRDYSKSRDSSPKKSSKAPRKSLFELALNFFQIEARRFAIQEEWLSMAFLSAQIAFSELRVADTPITYLEHY